MEYEFRIVFSPGIDLGEVRKALGLKSPHFHIEGLSLYVSKEAYSEAFFLPGKKVLITYRDRKNRKQSKEVLVSCIFLDGVCVWVRGGYYP